PAGDLGPEALRLGGGLVALPLGRLQPMGSERDLRRLEGGPHLVALAQHLLELLAEPRDLGRLGQVGGAKLGHVGLELGSLSALGLHLGAGGLHVRATALYLDVSALDRPAALLLAPTPQPAGLGQWNRAIARLQPLAV